MSRSSQRYLEVIQDEVDIQSEQYLQWVRDMQELTNKVKDKDCPFCAKKGLEPTGLDEFICTQCNNTGAIKGIL